VTNVAARLCALAVHGQVLTMNATADLLATGCECRRLGRRTLKNVTGPVEVVEILRRARRRAGIITRRTTSYG